MSRSKYIIACSKDWFYKKNYKFNNKNFILVTSKKKINYRYLSNVKPKYIFFPHWSYKIPKIVYQNFYCICFHTAPLPYGRGGSPIQNLILRDFKTAPVNAIRVEKKIDSGDIISKKKIKLNGSLELIFGRLSKVITQMIIEIVKKKKLNLNKQEGRIKIFKRIKQSQSNLQSQRFSNLKQINNHIRMLDHKDYPRSYLDFDKFRFYFSGSEFKKNSVSARVLIKFK